MPSALCPTHGLRFDPSIASGCSRCRASSTAPPPPALPSRRGILTGAIGVGALAAAGAATFGYLRSRRNAIADIDYAPGRHGAIFVPDADPPLLPRPLVLLFDPGGNAHGAVQRYLSAASQLGWIVASSLHIANGTDDSSDTDEMMQLLDYVRVHHPVADSEVYAAGVSGGGCGAYRLAIVKSRVVHGAIVECGHMGPWREVGAFADPALRFYLFTRDGDFNRDATRQLQAAMQSNGCRVTEVETAGGHTGMNDEEVVDALRWMRHG